MNRSVAAAAALAAFLSGCAGRDPIPVSTYKPSDEKLTCHDIGNEITANNHRMTALARESAATSDRNVMMGAAGVLLFAPILLAIDAKDAAATENRALEERNRLLADRARSAGCEAPTPYTVAMAMTEIGRSETGDDSGGPAAVKDVSSSDVTDARVEEEAPAPQRAAPPPPSGDLQDLMGRFLRGEISRAEYEQQRMQTASN